MEKTMQTNELNNNFKRAYMFAEKSNLHFLLYKF